MTLFAGVPTMYNAMLNSDAREKYDHSSLKLCCSGGSAMPGELMRGFEKAFDCKILEGYGLSETSPVASFNHPDKERKVGSIGTPIEGVEMKLVDDDGNDVEQGEVGEIAIKGHNVMKGYWNKPDATEEAIVDGWFHSGDMGKVDEDGYFFIVDRKKELIIRGGYNVYPREIEEVLYEHPAVLEAAVIGVPDDSMGEEVGAAVVLKEGEDVSADELQGVRQGARSPTTSTRARSGSSTSSPRARRARSSSARSRCPRRPRPADGREARPRSLDRRGSARRRRRRARPAAGSPASAGAKLAAQARDAAVEGRAPRRAGYGGRAGEDRDRAVRRRAVEEGPPLQGRRLARRTRRSAGSRRATSPAGKTVDDLISDAGLDGRAERRVRFAPRTSSTRWRRRTSRRSTRRR